MSQTITEWLRERLLSNVHQYGTFDDTGARKSHDEFFASGGVLDEVVMHAKARKLMGAFRYEQKGANSMSYDERARARQGPTKSYMDRAAEKGELYAQTGNKEYLVDMFNYVLLEWSRPYHPNAHFESTERHE